MTKVLVVDDLEANRYLLTSLLAGHGYEVEVATNGVQALALAASAPPALIITDLLMPDMDGYELCRRCRADPSLRRIPIFVYTATYTDPKDERLALSLGARRFLVKPQAPDKLLSVVREILNEAGRHPPARSSEGDDAEHLREHNERLVEKLGKKLRELEADVVERNELLRSARESADLLAIAGRVARLGGWSLDVVSGRLRCSAELADLLEAPAGGPTTLVEAKSSFAPEWREQAAAVFERCMKEGTSGDVEMELVTARGKRLWVRTICEAVVDASGAIREVHGAFQDVTDRKQAERERQRLYEEVVHSQRIESIGRLAGGVAHDFNNLLFAILSYSDFALETVREGDPLRPNLVEISKAAQRAAVLTRQLLAFSRRQTLQPKVVSLNLLLSGLEPMLRRLIRKDIEISLELGEAVGTILADPGQVEQVIVNLVVNARDAMPRGGRLRVATASVESAEGGRRAVLSVTDTGTGMDDATKARIFEPFFTTKKDQGTGLGLATVHGIVTQSGGSITVASELERGTTFEVSLPRVDPLAAESEPRPVRPDATGCESVLIVDDDPSVLTVAEQSLRRAGYRVVAVTSAGEALLASEELDGELDLLVTNVVMPRMSGFDLARRLAKRCPKLKVLYISGYSESGTALAVPPGARLVDKPISAAELARKVRDALDADGG